MSGPQNQTRGGGGDLPDPCQRCPQSRQGKQEGSSCRASGTGPRSCQTPPASCTPRSHPPARDRGQAEGSGLGGQTGRALHCTAAKPLPLPPQPRSSRHGGISVAVGFRAVVSSQQRWVSRSGGISVVVASWWWWSPSAGGIPGSHTLLGLCHKAQAARHLPPPQSPQSWAPPKASTAIQPGRVWLSRSRLCWKRLGKGSVGTRLAAGSSQLRSSAWHCHCPESAAQQLSLVLRGEQPLHNPPGSAKITRESRKTQGGGKRRTLAGRRWLSLYLQHPEVICEHTRSFQAPALAEQPVPCLRSCPAARPPAGRQHNGRLVPRRWRQPQPKTQPGAAPAHCAKTSGLLAHLPRCPGGRRWRTMGICVPNELPQRYPAAGAGPARRTGPSPRAVWSPKSGGRGGEGLCPAPHKPGKRKGVWPGVSWHGDVNTRTHAAPSGAALEHCPVHCHALSVCLPVSFPLSQGQCGEEERYPPQLGAHPWLLSTTSGQRLQCPPLPGTWGCRHPNLPSGRWAMPPTSPEWEGSQQGQTGRVRVQAQGAAPSPA